MLLRKSDTNEVAMKGMDIIEEAIAETEKELLG